jgi:hypothetical protein
VRQSLYTWLQRQGNGWRSLSAPDILLTAESTALSLLISQDHSGNTYPLDLLETLDSSSLPSEYTPPLTGPQTSIFTSARDMVLRLLEEGRDPGSKLQLTPIEAIQPRFTDNPQPAVLQQTRYCPLCNLKGLDLNGLNLNLGNYTGADFRFADLRNASLIDAQLKGADLRGARLDGATWINGRICEAAAIGTCSFEQRVHQYITGTQERPRIALHSDGSYVLTWASMNQDGDNFGIYARRYSPQGIALGPEFLVNVGHTAGSQYRPDIATAPDGRFLIVWESPTHDAAGAAMDVYGQWFDAEGERTGSFFRVNTTVASDQALPRVAIDAQGRAWVAWIHRADTQELRARRFDAEGLPVGQDILMATYEFVNSAQLSLDLDPAGNLALSWENWSAAGSVDIWLGFFDAEGQPLYPAQKVNQHLPDIQEAPEVQLDKDGNAVVSWVSHYQDEAGFDSRSHQAFGRGIYARRFAADSTPLGDEFLVNTVTRSEQEFSGLAVLPDGRFAISWLSWGHDAGGEPEVYLQHFNAAGQAVGPETAVATNYMALQPTLAANEQHIVTAWVGVHPDGNGMDVYNKMLGWPE